MVYVVYVRQARFGDTTNTIWPDVFHPARLDPGADLILLHPDGSEEVLVAGGNGGVTDPFVSFDAQWCYYSFFPDLRASQLNGQRSGPPPPPPAPNKKKKITTTPKQNRNT